MPIEDQVSLTIDIHEKTFSHDTYKISGTHMNVSHNIPCCNMTASVVFIQNRVRFLFWSKQLRFVYKNLSCVQTLGHIHYVSSVGGETLPLTVLKGLTSEWSVAYSREKSNSFRRQQQQCCSEYSQTRLRSIDFPVVVQLPNSAACDPNAFWLLNRSFVHSWRY